MKHFLSNNDEVLTEQTQNEEQKKANYTNNSPFYNEETENLTKHKKGILRIA